MTEEQSETRIIGDNKESKFIVYTADGTEFHLEHFYEPAGAGRLKGGDHIKFHPENIIAVRTRQVPT